VARDAEIVKLADKYSISGYEMAPLDRDQVVAFKSALVDMMKKQDAEMASLQVCIVYASVQTKMLIRRLIARSESWKRRVQ
jgi:hypothetical protein